MTTQYIQEHYSQNPLDQQALAKKTTCSLNTTDHLTAALMYAAAGLLVLPVHSVVIDRTTNTFKCTCGNSNCTNPGKHPASSRGLKDATTEMQQISQWWGQNHFYNIGIVPGRSGFNVIDVDPKNNGDFSLDGLIDKYGPMGFDVVPRVRTGSGGYHYWFKADPEESLSNSRGDLPEGIDVRGMSGYVVTSPSVHVNGNLYQWENIDTLHELKTKAKPLAPALLQIIKTQKTASAPAINVGNAEGTASDAVIESGQRNTTLTSLAGKYFAKNLNHDQVLALCLLENSQRCNPPLPENEVKSVVDSVKQYHATSAVKVWEDPLPIKKNELHPVLPFDFEHMLPCPLRAFVKDCAYRTQTPPDLIASPLVAMFSLLLGANYRMHPKQKDSWTEVPNLWSMIIAPPGSLKSNCLGEATKPVKYLAAKAHKQFEEANKNYQEALDAYEIQQDAIEKTLKKAYKNLVTCTSNQNAELEFEIENYKKQLAALNKPEEPFEKRYITSDATIEVLQEILKNNPGGLLVERDELIALLMSFTMSGHEADRGFYLEGWNGGGDYQVDRIGRGSTYVPHLCLSVVGATQPEKIQAYIIKNISALLNDGLVQRFQLMVYPDFTKRDYIDEYPDNAAKEAVYKIAATIASDAFLKDCKTKPSEFDDMPLLHFSFERVAQARFKEWLIALEKQIDEEESAILKEHWSKYRGLIPSLALIFHVITMAQTGQDKANPVTLDSLNIAIAWHPYLESHARRVYGMGSNLTEKVVEVLAKKLKQGMFDNGFSARDVYRKNLKGIGTDAEFAEIACEELEKLGWLMANYISPAKGQKAKTVYDINPNIKKIF